MRNCIKFSLTSTLAANRGRRACRIGIFSTLVLLSSTSTMAQSFGPVDISVGAGHVCTTYTDLHADCFGDNTRFQLGHRGETTPSGRPNFRVLGPQVMRHIDVGGEHTCAIADDLAVYCWGANDAGQLGIGSHEDQQVPQQVAGLVGVTAIALGDRHSCAVTADRNVYCWGDNTDGQVGTGAIGTSEASPTQVFSNVTAVATGPRSTCAVSVSGQILCWGDNRDYRVGTGDDRRAVPTVITDWTGASQVAVGLAHACAIVDDGQVSCLGQNSHGQLGTGTSEAHASPVLVPGVSQAEEIRTGAYHTCAHVPTGVVCWGSNTLGQLGDGTHVDRNTATPAVGIGANAMSLELGANASCVHLGNPTHGYRCWGALGGTTGVNFGPTPQSPFR